MDMFLEFCHIVIVQSNTTFGDSSSYRLREVRTMNTDTFMARSL